MIIDAHLHLLEREDFLEQTIRQMDASGIDRALVLGIVPEWQFMGCRCGDNRQVLGAVKQFPDRLIGSVYLDPREPDVLDTLDRYTDAGFRAAKFHSTVGYYMDDPICFKVYERLSELGWPVTVHCGLTNLPYTDGSGRITDSKFADPIHLDGIVRRFPKINWLIAHMAWPWFDVAWGLAQFNDNVYLDLAGPHAQTNGLQRIEREGFGFTCGVDLFQKMIWGSDCIETQHFFNQTRAALTRMGRSDALTGIFGQTIGRLLKLS